MTVGKYLDILKRGGGDQSDRSDKNPPANDRRPDFSRFSRFRRGPGRFCEAAFDALERRCPEYVDHERWQQAVADGRRFVTQFGEQAEALGWASADLFGLHAPPEKPAPNYRRLSRYDQTGLIWLLRGRPVIVLTATEAVMRCHTGASLTYRRRTEPVPVTETATPVVAEIAKGATA
jgi:hypothetical protein